MKKYRVNIQGMTCTGCEEHVAVALESMGARGVEVDFRRAKLGAHALGEIERSRAADIFAQIVLQLLLEFRILRVIDVLRFLFRIQVIEITVELIKPMCGGQHLIKVAEVIFTKLARHVALRL